MDVQLIIKIAGVGLITAVCCQILNKTGRDEQSVFLSLAGIVIVLFILVEKIGALFETMRDVFGL
ncbi:MAG: stage III sporulation protein AC [Ruminococcaceae bacterium]|nr:stage III sporulation protein AC [Oscillospiraceae bacterium]